ncbi:ABC transporter ATP-binding protein [Weissella paramesenteroides]|uniref:ABC transporter ATP-binding protein n=1 Tax=Weissella paramesenteroides TaxID=1249 RepID=UPI00103AD522|nr:ABC transporter ATP-binding protein [Weissella paramesenteroides]RZQ58180.1 ABC transporter ATP-binding protein [Weissella paramesenteroides]
MSKLIFDSVTKVFGEGSSEYVALDNINFEAESGQLILVVGPSITNLSKRQQTNLRLKKIGFVLQSYNLVPFLTVEEQFKFVDKINQNNLTENKMHELLEDLELLQLLKKYPNQLSGGQKQRVAIARALYTDPEYILADEPTAALDTERSMKVIELLKNLAHKRNKIIIVVTHDLRLKDIADRVYQIIDGKMTML